MPLLKYPFDALYEKSQDHLVISQYKYKPPYQESLFGNPLDILGKGLTRTSALKEFLGMVQLPIPNNVSDSNNVSWADDNMNNLSAAFTSYVAKNGTGALTQTIIASLVGNATGAKGAAQVAALGAALNQMGVNSQTLSNSQAIRTLLGSAGTSRALSMLGFQVSPESILSRGYGIIPNSNLELLFNAPTLREFTFQYRLSPRSNPEAKNVNQILRFFKQGMSVKKVSSTSGAAGAQSYFLGTPNVFQLQYKHNKDNTIKGLNRIKTCALVGFSVNYAPDGSWAAYDEGQPVSVIMNMSFKELEPVYDTDYQTTIDSSRLSNDNQVQDLYPIANDEVGY